MSALRNIPTNVITGFLGSGKSTIILDLLAQKPASENWAVLVNEFGEIGVDGNLIAGQPANDAGVFIKEVTGGCMCCTAGLPMQIAMSMLLARAKPSRLLIEPSGLGHPSEVLSVLQADHLAEVLDLRATTTLVDARKIADARYTSHATFNEQLEVADLIVASKADLYGADEVKALDHYLRTNGNGAELVVSDGGSLSMEALQGMPTQRALYAMETDTGHAYQPEPFAFPPEGFIRRENIGSGFSSYGWLFEAGYRFSQAAIEALLNSTGAERIKAGVKTDAGDIGYNWAGDVLAEMPISGLEDSRVEVITQAAFAADKFESALLSAACQRP